MPKHILVFNDTQEILDLFKDILTEEGYEVTLASYGTQDLDKVRDSHPDLIIADFPPLDREEHGWQLIQKLRMARDTATIPLIMSTTNLRAIENAEGWLASKGILPLPKPFVLEELIRAVITQIGPALDEQTI